ncbi:MAG: hypothetical protein ACRC8S_22090 [Fimbriiglobus sp.]
MSRIVLPCPSCQAPLGFPELAFGKPLNCPHCGYSFHVLRGADGQALAPVAGPPPRYGILSHVPKPLLVPALLLTLLGLTGLIVNGYLAILFATKPNADYDYAYGRVIEIRSAQGLDRSQKTTDDDWEQTAPAAVIGSAFAISSADVLEDVRNVELARSWQPAIQPTTNYSIVMCLLVFIAGVSMLRARWYWFCIAGCVAAILNFNHLCCIPGGLAGLWGILALVRDETRSSFGKTA